MAYQGWLIKIGNFIIPNDMIKADSYSAYVNSQALDPWTDANGYEHIDYVDLLVDKAEFETKAMLTDSQFGELMRNIRQYIYQKRKCIVTMYIPEFDEYYTQTSYMADIKPTIYGTYDGVIHYNPIRFAFIGGVYEG